MRGNKTYPSKIVRRFGGLLEHLVGESEEPRRDRESETGEFHRVPLYELFVRASGVMERWPDLLKLHQVLRDENLAGKMLLNFLNMADVIIIEMCQYHRLDVGARRQFSDLVG